MHPKNTNAMNNTLFIVCPFSTMEPFLRTKFGDDAFFLTAAGAVLPQRPWDFTEAVADFLTRQRIDTICIVNDMSCRFVDAIVRRKTLHGLPVETVLEDLYVEYYNTVFRDRPLFKQQYKLAELNVLRQARELLESSLIGRLIADNGITVKGLVTSRERDLVREVPVGRNTPVYEPELAL
jgi:carbonic anhydrase